MSNGTAGPLLNREGRTPSPKRPAAGTAEGRGSALAGRGGGGRGDAWGGAQAPGSWTSLLGQSLRRQHYPQAPGPPGRIRFSFPPFHSLLPGAAPCQAPWGVWRTHHPGSDIKWRRTKAGRVSSVAVGFRSYQDSKVRSTERHSFAQQNKWILLADFLWRRWKPKRGPGNFGWQTAHKSSSSPL